MGGAAHGLAAPPYARGAFSPPFLRVLLRPENLSHREDLTKGYSRLCGAENTREKRALRRAGIRGNSLPEGEIDAIVIVIELDIISIIITIISTIYTAITTAAPRHRCSNSGPKDPIYYEPVEFASHLKPSHPAPSESSDDVTTTFGGVRFIIDSEGFLRLPRAGTSGSSPPVSTEDTQAATLEIPPGSMRGEQSISFDRTDHPKAVPRPGHAALVLEAQIGGYNMSKVFMDGGSGLNLLFANTMKAMGLTVDMLRESDTGFHGIIPTRPAYSLGKTTLDVVFGTPTNFRREKIEFEVVDWESQYHAILGRPAFAKFMAVPHYAYLKLKMPGNNGTPITVHGSFAKSDTCDREFQKIASKFGVKEELNAIDAAVDHTQPPADNRNEGALIEFLRERWEIFAWEPSDMPGIPRELAEHALNVDPTAKPVQQSMRRFSEPKRKSIGEEINRLRKAGFIRELKEAEWVANPVMVPKKDTTALRMCIDYTGLNKHCPKDHFPLPRIDQIVDSTAGCDRLSFLDAYSGYNQIKLKKEDQELTAFITPHGVFCYNVMTFGLKNAGATYQRCMQACLGEQIGRNIEVYIDDIVVKTKHTATLVDDLRETFDNLDRYKIKLNPKKCFFGVPGGQVLGYFISARGIEAPLENKSYSRHGAAKESAPSAAVGRTSGSAQQVHCQAGRKSFAFLQSDEKIGKIRVDKGGTGILRQSKKDPIDVSSPCNPREKETLLMYIAATAQVFSSVLVVEREEAGRVHGVQRPVYYLSEVLTPARQRYPHHQKLAYAVWRSARKLRHYFTEHPIIVVSEAPLKNIMTNPEATGQVSQWAIEIAPHDITYVNRTAIKSQILPDFVADWIQSQTGGTRHVGIMDNVFRRIKAKHRRCGRSSADITARR
ncbi:hypothetical protein QYE76_031283 [Lolium multiflorum]|uniref:Reverse transcriptase n=1 Tax=Lolium multiflorum TaxID=4521 RepID=A0AAD8VK21_LOLMU|nr:hypothetical protein QYE76_031283 [Lolium multiflorum]